MTETAAVADASVLINLIAAGCFTEVANAAGIHTIYATKQVICELQAKSVFATEERRTALATVETVVLDPDGRAYNNYMQMIDEDRLDDGEASTIAYAHSLDLPALIDERRGMRICRKIGGRSFTSVDLFRRAEQGGTLTREKIAEAVFRALIDAKMWVAQQDEQWVLSLIGRERAKRCLSLRERIRESGSDPSR